jgi:hypothetical protein
MCGHANGTFRGFATLVMMRGKGACGPDGQHETNEGNGFRKGSHCAYVIKVFSESTSKCEWFAIRSTGTTRGRHHRSNSLSGFCVARLVNIALVGVSDAGIEVFKRPSCARAGWHERGRSRLHRRNKEFADKSVRATRCGSAVPIFQLAAE